MNEVMEHEYKKSVDFWNQALEVSDEELVEYEKQIDASEDWKHLSNGEKLSKLVYEHLADRENVLDYGCGQGWAGISIKKAGAKQVTCVDVIDNCIHFVNWFAKVFNISEGFQVKTVGTDWLSTVAEETYDGVICSNVLDVVPTEIARGILKDLSRICKKGAKVMIGLNFYENPVPNPEKNIEILEGNHMIINGVLRMVALTDEEWTKLLGEYFTVEKLEHFAWEGEEVERRRLFFLTK